MSMFSSTVNTAFELVEPTLNLTVAYITHVLQRMNMPTWEVYSAAFRTCANDLVRSSQSSAHFLYLTFRPIAILVWIILEILGRVGQVLFQHLLAQGWRSLQKGAMQAKAGIVWFYVFQTSLSRNEILGEVAVGLALVAGYYLRRWLKQQTYYARACRWCSAKKRGMVKQYTKTVNRIAAFSMFLAMLTPHALFLGFAVLVKLLLPRALQWLATETYSTALLSFCFPLVSTIGWIHSQRNPGAAGINNKETDGNDDVNDNSNDYVETKKKSSVAERKKKFESNSNDSSTKKKKTRSSERLKAKTSKLTSAAATTTKEPSYMRTTAAQKSRMRSKATTPRKNDKSNSGFFPKTKPATSSSTEDSGATNATSKQVDPVDGGMYWLQYWIVYASVQIIGKSIMLVPIAGRMVTRQAMLVSLTAEVRLFFFIWIFVMERVLNQTFNAKDEVVAKALPLNMLLRHLQPFIASFHDQVSHAVSPDTWEASVVSRAKPLLGGFVMIHFLSEDHKNWLIHVIEESRVLVVPSISLMMPGFLTQFGVLYVQFILPCAKSIQPSLAESNKQLHLEYWTLNMFLSGFLAWFSSLLWWIPFSTHVIFVMWCYLSLPKTVTQMYDIFELELVAFGLIEKPGHTVGIHETRTMQLMKVVASKLPSAVSDESKDDTDDQEDIKMINDADDDDDGNDDDAKEEFKIIHDDDEGKENDANVIVIEDKTPTKDDSNSSGSESGVLVETVNE